MKVYSWHQKWDFLRDFQTFSKCPISPSLMSLNSNDKGKKGRCFQHCLVSSPRLHLSSLFGSNRAKGCVSAWYLSFLPKKGRLHFEGFQVEKSFASSSRCHVSVFSKNSYSELCFKLRVLSTENQKVFLSENYIVLFWSSAPRFLFWLKNKYFKSKMDALTVLSIWDTDSEHSSEWNEALGKNV